VSQALADTALTEALDAARLQAATVVEGKLDFAGGERKYAVAFAGSDLGREGEDPGEVGARVRASAVREEVVAALDDWASIAGDGPRREWLLAVGRAADPDPERDRLRQPALWRDKEALARLAGEARAAELSPQLAAALGRALLAKKGDAVPLLRAAQALHPNDLWLNFALGNALFKATRWDEAVGHYRAALAVRPQAASIHHDLGIALAEQGKVAEAAGRFQQAIRLDPNNSAPAHLSLGATLDRQGKSEEAVGHFERALSLNPKLAEAHLSLGNALYKQGKVAEAVGHYEQALRIDPKLAKAQNGLGVALAEQGKVAEAVGHLEQALRFNPKDAEARVNFGNALHRKGKLDEAVGHYEEALRLDPKLAKAHFNLGNALYAKGRVDQAVGHYEQALRLDPGYAFAYGALGEALLARGRWAEARAATRRCLGLLPPRHPLRAPVTQLLQQSERMLALEARLPAVLAGKDRPAGTAECLQFAHLCQVTKRYTVAARLYADAFAADPKLAEDLRAAHRYNAACCAARAAGQGADAPKPEDKERARLRGQALGWLRADLALRQKQADSAKAEERAAAQRTLRHWQQAPDLAGVRDKQALAKLAAEERAEWEKLWAEVADLLRRLDADKRASAPDGK
jgi:tetratricopeptide (TPR) repeat protein